MTQEEKAKAYDETIEKLRDFYRDYDTVSCLIDVKEELANLFPELKESEDVDKKILEEIIATIHLYYGKPLEDEAKEMIAWLEKQCEPVEINPTEFDTRLQSLIRKFNSLSKEELIGSLSFWLNVVKNDGTYKSDEKQGEFIENNKDDVDTDFTIYHPLKNGKGRYECIPYSFYGTLSSFSEDKDMIDFLRLCFYTEEECNEWIKQNESTDTLEHKFNVGDWVTTDKGDTIQITAANPGYYTIDNGMEFSTSYVDKYWHLWAIQDAKDGDVLSNGQMIVIFKHFEEPSYRQHIVAYIGLDINSNIQITDDTWNFGIDKAKPATKEQCNILFTKMKEIGYEWDADKKELKKIEQKSVENLTDVDHEYYSDLLSNDDSDNIDDYAYQCAYCMSHDWMKESATWEDVQYAVKLGAEWQKQKPAWSEEDENILQGIWDEILTNKHDTKEYEWKTYDKFLNWLKSLKDRVQSKPKQEWKQENTDDLTDFENTMMHIGDSFFGENAGLDPNDTDTVKEQAELLLELASSKEWSKEDDYNLQCMIAKAVKDIRDGNVGRNNELIYWLKSIKQRIVGKV